MKSLQAIYFVPAKVLLGAGGKGIGVLGLCQAAELFLWTAEITLLIALKGKWDTGKINWFAQRWTESLQLYETLKPTPDGSCSTSNYFYLFTVCVQVTFYGMVLRDGCFFKHLPTETINIIALVQNSLLCNSAQKKSYPVSWGVKDSVRFPPQERWKQYMNNKCEESGIPLQSMFCTGTL